MVLASLRASRHGHLLSGRFVLRLFSLLLLLPVALWMLSGLSSRKEHLSLEFRHLQTLQSKAVPSEACKVPQLDPWDPSIRKYYSKPDKLVCSAVQKQIASFSEGQVKFNATVAAGLKCWISVVEKGEKDSEAKYSRRIEVNLSRSTEYEVAAEFMEVNCETQGLMNRNVYRYHFHNVQAKSTNLRGIEVLDSSAEHPSVVMIGLDSMSYGNMLRQMPRTHSLLENMGFVDMRGHVKIGDNTYANWLAILSGKRGTSTKEFRAELPESWDIYFDDFPFVWNNFSDNGYATLFAEDRPDIGTFNYFGYLCGFRKAPVDHYFRPFWLAAFWSIVARRSKPFCYDSEARHDVQLAYLDRFVNKYKGKRHFAFWWTQDMSHDYLNVIGKTDDSFAEFLQSNSKTMEDSIVIVFSDHGHRYDKIRETVIGRLEARLPFLSIRIPDQIKKKYPHVYQNLLANAHKMTTQFDLNESLNRIATGSFVQPGPEEPPKQRAYSIWHATPTKRTCFEAEIPEDYCPCFTEVEIPAEEAKKPAEELVAYLNGLLSRFDDEEKVRWEQADSDGAQIEKWTCEKLKIAHIAFSSIRLPPQKVIDDPQTGGEIPVAGIEIQYRVVFEAEAPSGALIEGVVVKNFNEDTWRPTGEVERNNKYGNTSSCVADRTLKKLCHCVRLHR